MSNIPIFSYKQYLADISKMTQTGTIGANRQAEAPQSAGSRGLRRIKQFIKDPVHLMGESEEGRPTPAQPNGIEEEATDKKSIPNIAKKFNRSEQEILDQVKKGVKVEAEHTDQFDLALKIALDHLDERPDYYDMLDRAEKSTVIDDQSMDEVFESWLDRRIPEQFHERARHWFEAKYQGRTVPLNKPMRGDVKKSKVYVTNPKTGNVKKVNFGHGGTSAKKLGQKTMSIKKSNPSRRKSFRARHKCDTAKDKTTARYWSCRAW